MCSHVAEKQDGNGDFFWKEFVGWGIALFPKLRGGDTHQPPNTLVDYDYYNSDLVLSDFLDWEPGGGKATLVNKDTWGNVPYNWPPAKLPESYNAPTMPNVESNWYLMWMQGFPGYGNKIPYGSRYLSNWWRFVVDWDKNYNIGLHQANVEENAKCTDISTKFEFSDLQIAKFDIYPNPGSHQIKVSYPKAFDLISIIDVYGKHYPLFYRGQNNYTLDLARFSSGIYFIQSSIEGKPRIQKFIVHK